MPRRRLSLLISQHPYMKLPSIKNLTDGIKSVIKRFTFEMLFALTGTIAGIVYIELTNLQYNAESWCARTIMIANLGLLLSLTATLYTTSRQIAPGKKMLIKVSAALFLTGALYSAVLFAGISAALGAMNFLFNFKFEWDTFAILWTLIVGLFSTTFFLGGVPDELQQLDQDESYPKGLKIFTQYVLIPLATIYVLILLSYEIKILLQWNLPKGMVSNLILCYAVFGILSILLVYPIRDQQDNKWIKTFARSFYFLLVPLIILLLLAVGTRVFRYGITEWRYFLIVLAAWLFFITIYFLVSKKQNIKMIPMSLSLLTLLTVYGPQSAFSVSEYSQQQVLINIFKRNNAFKDGKLLPVDSSKISRKDGNRAVATLDYLITHHDMASIDPYITADWKKVADTLGMKDRESWVVSMSRYDLHYDKLSWIKKRLHLSRFSGYDRYDDDEINYPDTYVFSSVSDDVYKVTGMDYIMTASQNLDDTTNYQADNLKIRQRYNRDNSLLKLDINNETMTFELKDHILTLMKDTVRLEKLREKTDNDGAYSPKRYNFPVNNLNITRQTQHYAVTLRLTSISFESAQKTKADSVSFFNGEYLIKVKK
jgi:hypothetical protein